MTRLSPSLLVGALLAVGALSCGDVPTLPEGIAYISGVIMPSPAVALGDTLRDSLGRAAPLRIHAIGINGDTVVVTPTFVVTTVPGKSATVSPAGFVVGDSLRTVQIVGRVGERLQTPNAPLEVVLQPDSLGATTTRAKITGTPGALLGTSEALTVTVTSGAGTTRTGVRGIIVRYRIAQWFPAAAQFPDTTLVLLDESNRYQGADGRLSVDTTDGSGNASRRVRALTAGYDSLEVLATANDLRGMPLRGSPLRFIVTSR